MPISSNAAWGVVLPVAKQNLLLNPSFERGTLGAAAIQSATLGSTAGFQQFGAWSLSLVPNSNGTSGAALGTWTAGNGTDYTVSAYVWAPNNGAYMIGVGDSNGLNLVGSTAITGGGSFHRYSYSYTESSGAVRRVVVRKTSGVTTSTMYIDGVQAEVGSLTTYIDGDQDGCYWLGATHASAATRSGTYRGGGSVVALADLGFTVGQAFGIGMPLLENTSQSFALTDGAEYQHTRASARPFTLTARVEGTSQRDYHITRRTILNALKINSVSPQQPCRFWYVGAEGTVAIDAVQDTGMEGAQSLERDGFGETAAVRFIAHDPYWRATTDEGTALAARVALGSAIALVYRDPIGKWGTLGANGSTVQNGAQAIYALLPLSGGTVMIGGNFGTVGGTVNPAIGLYFPATNTFGTLTGGTLLNTVVGDTNVYALGTTPSGSVLIGGGFLTAGGTRSVGITRWNGNYGTLIGGTIGGVAPGVTSLFFYGGTTFLGGAFESAGGTQARFVAFHQNNNAYGTLRGGTLDGQVNALARGFDGKLHMTGLFGSAGGTIAIGFAVSANGSFGTVNTGLGSAGYGQAVVIGPNGLAYVGGQFGTAGPGPANNIASYNGVQMTALGSGVQRSSNPRVDTILVDPLTGNLFVGGRFGTANGKPVWDGMAQWNGYAWLPMDIDIAGVASGTIQAFARDLSGTLWVGGQFQGTAQAASVATLINTGMAEAYPIMTTRNTGSGTARVAQIVNTLTGDGVYFDLVLQSGEEATLDLTPGVRSFTSPTQGNIFGRIIAGSNLATFRLMPGTNYLSFFADSDNLLTTIYWRPRHDSSDGGTVY